MEKIVEQAMLYDFYGALLTKHQRAVYEAAIFDDLSLSELSEIFSITRQGVHDLIKRCDQALESYEKKLHLLEKSRLYRSGLEEILNTLHSTSNDNMCEEQIEKICRQLIEEI